MTLHHCCGWAGLELELAWWDGIAYALTCPNCGDEWPFFYDESCPLPDHDLPAVVSRHADAATRRLLERLTHPPNAGK